MVAKEQNFDFAVAAFASDEQLCWYAIYTKPSKEDVAVEYISRMAIEAFNPKIRKERKIWGVVKETTVPLFPCYIFAKFGLSSLPAIRFTRGVRRIVGAGEAPTPIEERVIAFIRSQMMNAMTRSTVSEVKRGDQVIINRGALFGLEGVFLEEVSSKDRVSILLKAVEWQARVLVEKDAFEKLV